KSQEKVNILLTFCYISITLQQIIYQRNSMNSIESCFICHQQIDTSVHCSFSNHLKTAHNISRKIEYLEQYVWVGDYMKCACGCGLIVKPLRFYPYKRMYKSGHNSVGETNPMYGKHFSDESKKQMSDSAYKRMEIQKEENNGILPMHLPEALQLRGKLYSEKMMAAKAIKYNVTLLATREEQKTGNYNFKCNVCNTEHIERCNNGFICKHCYPKVRSKMENELLEFIQNEVGLIAQHNNKTILGNMQELDCYIPSLNIAIELNGLYWHSEIGGKKDKKYHINKMQLCNEKGIRLIQIFEDEWVLKKDIVKSKLAHIFGKSTLSSKYAKNCNIIEITPEVKNTFLNNNHIQGADKSSVSLGAFQN